MYTLQKITQLFRRLGVYRVAMFTRAAREPAYNNRCDPLIEMVDRPWSGALPIGFVIENYIATLYCNVTSTVDGASFCDDIDRRAVVAPRDLSVA